MNENPLVRYRIDQPLTEEEEQLIDMLHAAEGGESYLQSIKGIGTLIDTAGGGKRYLASQQLHANEVEAVVGQQLLPLSAHLYQQGNTQLALGAYVLALRLGLEALGPEHRHTLACRTGLAVCLQSLGQLSDALSLYESTLEIQEQVICLEQQQTLACRNGLAVCLYSLGRFSEALPLYESTLAIQERVLGPEQVDTLFSRYNLATCLYSLSRFGEALPLYDSTMKIQERVLGPEHQHTLACRTGLAMCLQSLGRLSEALPLYKSTLEIQERVLGVEHQQTLNCKVWLAGCLQGLGQYKEALPLYEAMLGSRERVLGSDHPDTLASRNSLAECLRLLGRTGEALSLHEVTLAVRERVLGPNDAHTLTSRNNLALCLVGLGRSDEALPLFESTLTAREQAHGSNHPHTLMSRANLAYCLDSLERFGEALPLHKATLAARERVLGLEHPDTLMSRANLADCLDSLGRSGEASPLHEATLAARERVLGSGHPDTLSSRSNLAYCQNAVGRFSEALPIHEAALATSERVLGLEHPGTLTSRHNLAFCLEALGRLDEALPLHKATLAARERVLGLEHPDTLMSRNSLAVCLYSLARLDEALPMYKATLEAQKRVLGPDHPDTFSTIVNLSACLHSLGRSTDALKLLQGMLEVQKHVQGSEHPHTFHSMNNTAMLLDSLGQLSEALPLYETTLAARERIQGSEHPDTLLSRNNLAGCLDSLGQSNEALAKWLSQTKTLQAQPQPGGRWLEMLGYCATALANHVGAGRLPDWPHLFDGLSTALLGVIDLVSPEQLEAARAGVAQFYSTYLGLCLDQDRCELIPQVLAVRQGRKLASLVLDELEVAGSSLDPESLRGRFQAIRLELRQLALGLRVVEGGPGQPGQRTLDAASVVARQRNQMEAYKAKLDEYRALRAELEQNDPDFAVTAAALKPTMSELQARLGEGEGLVLLFEHSGEGDAVRRFALLVAPAASVLVPLPEGQLQQGLTLSQTWGLRGNMRSVMHRAMTAEETPDEVPETTPVTEGLASELATAMHDGLWAPLAPHISGLTGLHLVTHGGWHLLPVEHGAPDGLELASYPGFIYYHRLRHQGRVPGSPLTTGQKKFVSSLKPAQHHPLGLAVHAAEHDPGLEPIPFVKAEAKLVEALWLGSVHADPDLTAEHPELATLQLAAHGQADKKDPARANVLLKDQILDFQGILGARQHPPVVVLSACTVGRTSDDPDGEPLGLVGSFLLKGSCYVIAALQPVPDFYMPLLITLFYQSWLTTGAPDTALSVAKRRLRMGDWYEDTEHLIRTHYKPIIEQMIEAVISQNKTGSWDDSLLRLTHAWPFPERYRYLHPDEHQHRLDALMETISSAKNRAKLAEEILDTLVTERDRLPGMVIDTLCTWVRGFGDAVAES